MRKKGIGSYSTKIRKRHTFCNYGYCAWPFDKTKEADAGYKKRLRKYKGARSKGGDLILEAPASEEIYNSGISRRFYLLLRNPRCRIQRAGVRMLS